MLEKGKSTVGIITAPGRAAAMCKNIINQLANQLSKDINNDIEWKVDWFIDQLIGIDEAIGGMLYYTTHIKNNNEWDYAICLTDLPILHEKDVVAADINFNNKVALISMPAFGWPSMQKLIKKTIIQLLSELHENDITDHSLKRGKQIEKTKRYLLGRQFPIMPIRRKDNPNLLSESELDIVNNELQTKECLNSDTIEKGNSHQHSTEFGDGTEETIDNHIDVRFIVYPRFNGLLRLILGITFTNNPMTIMSSFKNMIAIAFTTGAFALIFPTIWNLGQIFSVYRLGGMMFAAIFGLATWIIVAHNLWELSSTRYQPNIRRLYNLATTATLIINVTTYYIFMFILFLVACLIFIPMEYFQAMINEYDDIGSTLVNYMRVAWATTSISTIVSAIGAGLENKDLVQNITYGSRQNHRYKEMNNNKNI